MNNILLGTLLGGIHLLVIWVIGLGWAIAYRKRHRRISWLAGIALLLLIVNQFVLQPYLTWLLMQEEHVSATPIIWLGPVIEGIAWVILLGTLFDRREQQASTTFRPSEHTSKCPQCGYRNARSAELCLACGLRLSETEAKADLTDFAKHYFNWNHELGISKPRRRGAYRALTGVSLVAVGGLIWLAFGSDLAVLPVVVGFASLPCAAAEMITNRSWNQVGSILRIGLLSVAPFVFAGVVVLAAMAKMRVM